MIVSVLLLRCACNCVFVRACVHVVMVGMRSLFVCQYLQLFVGAHVCLCFARIIAFAHLCGVRCVRVVEYCIVLDEAERDARDVKITEPSLFCSLTNAYFSFINFAQGEGSDNLELDGIKNCCSYTQLQEQVKEYSKRMVSMQLT